MDLAFKRQKFSEFADVELNGCRLIVTKLFKFAPAVNLTIEGFRTFHRGLIL